MGLVPQTTTVCHALPEWSSTHLFQFHVFAYTVRVISVPELSLRVHVYVHDDHYHTCSKFNSLLTEMIIMQVYIHILTLLLVHSGLTWACPELL